MKKKKSIIDFLKDPYKLLYAILKRASFLITNDELYIKLAYFAIMNKPISLRNPQTYNYGIS